MPDNKIRGLKRKTKNMIQRIEEATTNFPSDYYNGYWHLHLPVAQNFISSNKTPFGIKRLCIQTLLSRAEHLINIKPSPPKKLVLLLQLIYQDYGIHRLLCFQGIPILKVFLIEVMNSIPLSKERNIGSEWGLNISKELDVVGFIEEITDEVGLQYKSEIWFVGELK